MLLNRKRPIVVLLPGQKLLRPTYTSLHSKNVQSLPIGEDQSLNKLRIWTCHQFLSRLEFEMWSSMLRIAQPKVVLRSEKKKEQTFIPSKSENI